jgi:hypothetical protein
VSQSRPRGLVSTTYLLRDIASRTVKLLPGPKRRDIPNFDGKTLTSTAHWTIITAVSEAMSREDHKSLDGDGVVDSEPLMVHEHWSSKATWKLKTTARLSRAQKFCLAIWSARYMLDTALLLVILLVILLRSANVDSQSQLETSGDITGFAPTSTLPSVQLKY